MTDMDGGISMRENAVLTIQECFAHLDDPRRDHLQPHRLLDSVVMAIGAPISNADGWVEIEPWGRAKLAWLHTVLVLPNGIPSHDTFGRVFAALDPEQFRQGFLGGSPSSTRRRRGRSSPLMARPAAGRTISARARPRCPWSVPGPRRIAATGNRVHIQ
jgi:hypothetical protein